MPEQDYWPGWPVIKLGDKPLDGYKRRQYNRRKQRQKVQLDVIAILKKSAQGLAYGISGTQISESELKEILASISQNKPGYHLKWARNFVVLGINRGNREGIWSIDTPDPVLTMRRDPSAFTPKDFELLGELRRLQKHFMSTLESDFLSQQTKVEDYDLSNYRKLRVGQILFCAMTYGGLLDSKLITLLPIHFQKIYIDNPWCWIDLYEVDDPSSRDKNSKVTENNKKPGKKFRRRWFVDQISELLLYRWNDDGLGLLELPKGKAACERALYGCVHKFFIETGFQPKDKFPSTLKGICQLVSIDVGLRVPGFLAAYAKGKVSSQSLPPQAWLRLRKNIRGPGGSEVEDTHEARAIKIDSILPHDHWVNLDRFDQKNLFKLLRNSFYRKRGENIISHPQAIKNIKQFVNENRGRMAAPLLWLASWAIDLLEYGTSHFERVTVKTVYEYLGHTQLIVDFLGNLNPAILDREELEGIYSSILNSIPTDKARCFKAGRLKEFHYFLNLHIRPIQIDFAGVSSCKDGGKVDVDANIITETEYTQAMEELGRYAHTELRLTIMRRLALMLAYRFGLRRTEAWLLRLRHIIGQAYPELWVVNTANKKLKRERSRRRLSLNGILSPDEHSEVMNWCNQRMTEEGLDPGHPNEALFFCLEGGGHRPVPESELFDPIHEVLRAVTGDPNVRFHHGRDSLVNHRLIKLIQCKGMLQDSLPKTISQQIYPLVCEKPTRRNLFALAMALGHRSPYSTLHSYVHVCDLLLYSFLIESSPELPMDALCNITGQNKDNIYKYRKRNYSEKSLTEAVLLRKRKILANQFQDPLTKNNHAAVTEPIEWPEVDANPCLVRLQKEPPLSILHQIIIHYDKVTLNEDYWSKRLGHNKDLILCWVNVAKSLSQCTSKRQTPRHIRPMWWNIGEDEGKAQVKQEYQIQPRTLMPQPKLKTDIADMNYAIEALRKLRCSQPKLAKWGVDYFIDHNVASHSHMYMQSEMDAKRYVEFLLALGFSKRRISIQFRPQQKAGSSPISKQAAFWSELLSISSKYFKLLEAMTKRGPEMGSVYITISNQTSENVEISSYGFAYALFMTGILMVSEELVAHVI